MTTPDLCKAKSEAALPSQNMTENEHARKTKHNLSGREHGAYSSLNIFPLVPHPLRGLWIEALTFTWIDPNFSWGTFFLLL